MPELFRPQQFMEVARFLAATPSDGPRLRAAVSRAYYAAYSAATDALVQSHGVAFGVGRDGPPHRDLPRLVESHLRNRLGFSKIREIKAALRRLYVARLDADYRPKARFEWNDIRIVLSDAALVLARLEPE